MRGQILRGTAFDLLGIGARELERDDGRLEQGFGVGEIGFFREIRALRQFGQLALGQFEPGLGAGDAVIVRCAVFISNAPRGVAVGALRRLICGAASSNAPNCHWETVDPPM